MAEPRARLRQKGKQFPDSDIEAILIAFGDDTNPLQSTVAVLDEILTDFIIESCHCAALSASYSRRQKIKVDDFRWVLRRDGKKLGRVGEMYLKERMLKESRKVLGEMDFGAAAAGKRGVGAGAGAEALGALVGPSDEARGEAGEGKKKGRKRKKRAEDEGL